jgi:hexosaminidase
MKLFFSSLFFSIGFSSFSQSTINLVPYPASIKMLDGNFTFNKSTYFLADKSTISLANLANDYLKGLYGFTLPIKTKSSAGNYIGFYKKNLRDAQANEYHLEANKRKVVITGINDTALFYGLQTFLQLLPAQKLAGANYTIPAVSIIDYPRFTYRGMHLDVSRHFFNIDFIKKYIDYLSYLKFNNFHWHLTDDQGWRIEIKKYPLLTQIGGFRNGTITGRYPGITNDSLHYGGFYTQKQIKEIVAYAAKRYINVIPEIEMPGHASAAIAAYPQLSCFPNESTKVLAQTPWAGSRDGKQVQQTWGVFEDVFCPSDYTFQFLENVLDEVMALFPSKYIHIGGDECPKESWKRSAFCQNLIAEKGLKDEHGLQSYFIEKMEKYINSKGRRIIGWDEILEGGLAPNATVMSWRGEEGGITAAQQHHDVIMTPGDYVYFDHSQSRNEDSVTIGGYLPLEKVYNYEPVPEKLSPLETPFILGAQANVWTEYMEYPSKVEYMIFPRMSALSEVLWSSKANKDWKRFSSYLPKIFNRYKLWKTNSSNAYYDLQSAIIPGKDSTGIYLKLSSAFDGANLYYQFQNNTNWEKYTQPVKIDKSTTVRAYMENNEKKSNVIQKNFSFNKATGKKINIKELPANQYAGSGAFTLVNGIVTSKGLTESTEWLGFLGKDLEAVIDLGKMESIQVVSLFTLDQKGSWIYLPKEVDVYFSNDGKNFELQQTKIINPTVDNGIRKIDLPAKGFTRWIKIIAKNAGIIPVGFPGAGNPAWLFADEIVVN